MIGIHIVCAHDAVKLAETLMRLLEAEEHQVRLSYGRQSQGAIEAAKTSTDAIILIWSDNAASQHYMLEWARQIPEQRLIELARTNTGPRSTRKAPVIDFTNWRGVRGARAWNALNDRLRHITRALEPARPQPKRAALALGIASLAAVTGAIAVRVSDNTPAPAMLAMEEEAEPIIAFDDPVSGIGGPLRALEPASVHEINAAPVRAPTYIPLDADSPDLLDVAPYEPLDIRDATLMERLSSFNPLRRGNDED